MKYSLKFGCLLGMLSTLVLAITTCKDARNAFEYQQKRIVKASLGPGGRSKRSVSDNTNPTSAYYQSKFKMTLNPKNSSKRCLTYDPENLQRGAYFTDCVDGDTRQIWYQDYNANVFSLYKGKKYCTAVTVHELHEIPSSMQLPPVPALGVTDTQCEDNSPNYKKMWRVSKLNKVELGKLNLSDDSENLYKLEFYIPGKEYGLVYTNWHKDHGTQDDVVHTRTPYITYGITMDAISFPPSLRWNAIFNSKFEPLRLEFLKKAKDAGLSADEYYATFVKPEKGLSNTKKALPFFINKKTGQHLYIGKDIPLSDLVGYRFVAEQVDWNSDDTQVSGIYHDVIDTNTKLDDLAFGKDGSKEYVVCVYDRNGKTLGGGCTGIGASYLPLNKKPKDYAYGGAAPTHAYIREASVAPSYYESKTAGYVDANKFWLANNVLLTGDANEHGWSVSTSYVQRGKVRSVQLTLPFFTTDEIKKGTNYKISFSAEGPHTGLRSTSVATHEGAALFGYLELRRGTDVNGQPQAEVSFYIRKKQTYEPVNSITIPVLSKTQQLTEMPVFTLMVDIDAKKAIVALGINNWNEYGQTNFNKDAIKLLDLTKYEIHLDGLSSSFRMSSSKSNTKLNMKFYTPRVFAGLNMSLKDASMNRSTQSRQKRSYSAMCKEAVDFGPPYDQAPGPIVFLFKAAESFLGVFSGSCIAYAVEVNNEEKRKEMIEMIKKVNENLRKNITDVQSKYLLSKDKVAFFHTEQVEPDNFKVICELNGTKDVCGGRLGSAAYNNYTITFLKDESPGLIRGLQLTCFKMYYVEHNQPYDHLCVINQQNIENMQVRVERFVSQDKDGLKQVDRLKSIVKGNTIRFLVPRNYPQYAKDVVLYLNFKAGNNEPSTRDKKENAFTAVRLSSILIPNEEASLYEMLWNKKKFTEVQKKLRENAHHSGKASDQAAIFNIRKLGTEDWIKLCDLENNTVLCERSFIAEGNYNNSIITFYSNFSYKRMKIALTCTLEKQSIHKYHDDDYLCILDQSNVKIKDIELYQIGSSRSKKQKITFKGNTIRLQLPKPMSVTKKSDGTYHYTFKDTYKLHVTFMVSDKTPPPPHYNPYEYQVEIKLPAILIPAHEPILLIEDSTRLATLARKIGLKKVKVFPDFRNKGDITVNKKGLLAYHPKGKSDENETVSFTCPGAVPGGTIYRCTAFGSEKVRQVEFGVLGGDRILKSPATSDGITNANAQLHGEAYFGPGTRHWNGSGNNAFIETRATPRDYVDVFFEDTPHVSTVQARFRDGKKTITIKQPVGVVKVNLDIPPIVKLEKNIKDLCDPRNRQELRVVNNKRYFQCLRPIMSLLADDIVMNAHDVTLIPPTTYPEAVNFIIVGFVQVVKNEELSVDFYEPKSKKMRRFSFNTVSPTKSARSFKQYDGSVRVYPYVDSLTYQEVGVWMRSGSRVPPPSRPVYYGDTTSQTSKSLIR